MPWRRLLFGGVIVLLLAGCGDEKQTPVPSAPPVPKSKSLTVTATLLELNAEYPPTTGCLEASMRGAASSVGLRWQVNGQVVADQTGTKLCREFFRKGDEVSVSLQVGGQTLTRSLRVENAPPRVTDVTFQVDATNVSVQVTTADADEDSVDLRYQWVINGEPNTFLTEAVVPRRDLQRSDQLQVLIIPNDGVEDGPTYTSRVFSQPNLGPQIVSTPPATFEAIEYSYQVKAKDPEGDRLTFSLKNPPAGMTINSSTGRISWPLTGVTPGKYEVKIVVRDPKGDEDRQEFVLTLGDSGGG